MIFIFNEHTNELYGFLVYKKHYMFEGMGGFQFSLCYMPYVIRYCP